MSRSRYRGAFWPFAALLCMLPAPLVAQPRMDLPAPATIADRGAPGYRFETLRIASEDGQRRYRVVVGVPDGPAPRCGHAALWLLDGKAALAHVDEDLLDSIASSKRPVIVALGHDSDLRLDGEERIRDYTPGIGSTDARGRKGGGADSFLALIETRIRPAVAELTPLDPARQGLWGHSLGGLFVLHALFDRPEAFSLYFAASPSLWWNGGAIHGALDGFTLPPGISAQVIVADGTPPPGADERPRATRPWARDERASGNADTFLAELEQRPRIDLARVVYPGAGHGGTLSASVPDAVRATVAMAASGGDAACR